ncbi:hypothetical protein A2U01_0084521, partial [Trifolium medium]|nr:hypothetical protein [Trifolium medium]
PGPSKKHKPPTIPKKQTPQITQGAEASGAIGGDEVPTGTAAELGVVQSSSSRTAPASDSAASPSLWDPLFNPMEFIEREINIAGDI